MMTFGSAIERLCGDVLPVGRFCSLVAEADLIQTRRLTC